MKVMKSYIPNELPLQDLRLYKKNQTRRGIRT